MQYSTNARVITTANDLAAVSAVSNFQHTVVCDNVGIGGTPTAVRCISSLGNSFAVQINDDILTGLNYQTSNRICCTHGEVGSKFSLLSQIAADGIPTIYSDFVVSKSIISSTVVGNFIVFRLSGFYCSIF